MGTSWGPPAGPVVARQAPFVFALVLIHPVPTLIFTLWAIDGLLHCDEAEKVTCHLGFAIHLLFPTAVAVGVAVTVGVVGLVIRPSSRARARLMMLLPTILTWLTLWAVLAATAEPGPAPWASP